MPGEVGRHSFASDRVDMIEHLAKELQCTLVVEDQPEGYFEKVRLAGHRSADIIYATAARMRKHVQRQAWGKWEERIARIPWTPKEIKDRLKIL